MASEANPDGGDVPPGSVTETLKLLKRLGYPESQDVCKSSALLTKVNAALTKRMGKLEAAKQSLLVPGVMESQLSKKKLGYKLKKKESILFRNPIKAFTFFGSDSPYKI